MPLPIAAIMAGGALAGGVGSMLSGNQGAANVSRARRDINALKAQFPGQAAQIEAKLSQAYSPYLQNAGADLASFRRSAQGLDPANFAYEDAPGFDYNMQQGIQSFMDPSTDFQIRQATRAVEGSAANAGKLFSSATGKGIADRSQAIAAQSWKDALQAAMADRAYGREAYESDVGLSRQEQDQRLRAAQAQAGVMGQLAGMGQQASMGYGEASAGNLQNLFQSQNQADLLRAQMLMQKPQTGFGAFMSGAGQTLGALAPFAAGIMAPGGK